MSEGSDPPIPGEAATQPSKSQVKRELHALQQLGEQLAGMQQQRLDPLPLSDALRRALAEIQRISAHGARRRQIRWIGKLLRGEKTDLIEKLIEATAQHSVEETRRFHALERWRDRLLTGDQPLLTQFLDEHPDADSQHLRQLIRTAHKEQEQGKPPTASRKLFKYLRELGSV